MDRGLLDFALENGILDEAYIQAQIEMKKREECLSKHKNKIWLGKDGYWRTYIEDPKTNRRKLIKKKSRQDIEDVVVKDVKASISICNDTFDDLFKEWNDRRLSLKKISPATHVRNQQMYNRFFSSGFGQRKIGTVDPEEFGEFLEELIPKYDLKHKAWSGIKSIVRNMMIYARKKHMIDYSIDDLLESLDITDSDFTPVMKEDYEEVFDDNERKKIINYASDFPDQRNLGILLMFYTGMRIGELSALKQKDLEETNCIKIRRTETRYKENGEWVITVKENPKTNAGWRTIVLPSEAQWIVNRIKGGDPEDWVFERYRGVRMHACSFRKRLKKICDELKIYPKSPHKIRKTYASILLDNHVDARMVLDQMGHASISTTNQSYYRNRKDIQSKQRLLNNLPEFAQ